MPQAICIVAKLLSFCTMLATPRFLLYLYKDCVMGCVTCLQFLCYYSRVSSRNNIHYSAATQITVTLDPSVGQCCVGGVSQKVKDQVGFDAILLDSKCYPL